jgi:hypothetical protein
MSHGNRMKAKGTTFETQVVNYLKVAHAFVNAYRPATSGAKDSGDINGIRQNSEFNGKRPRQAIVQCKNAKTFSLSGWLNDANEQAQQEAVGGDALPVVVFKRPGMGEKQMGEQYALLRLEDLAVLLKDAGYV